MKLSYEFKPAYAHIGVTGDVDASDAASLREAARDRAGRHESKRVLVDLRDAELSREARDAVLDFARIPEAVSAALVTTDDLFVAEVNMASLAAGSRARAFAQHSDAHRWLARGSMVKTGLDLPKDHPRHSERPVDAEARRRALFDVPPRSRPPDAPRPTPRSRPEPFTERPTARTERPLAPIEPATTDTERPRRATERPQAGDERSHPKSERPTLSEGPPRKR